jgi:ATP-binding cassette subfamily F protein 3
LAVIGPNGKGKTTLLNVIAGELTQMEGTVEHNPNTKLNYFGQTNVERLHPGLTVEEEILTAIEEPNRARARSLAGLMMFEGDLALKKISVLSGGERSRVLLAKILGRPCNLLLLDEPTNHLDMESVDSLIEALEEFHGAAILVSHDEELLHNFANKLIVFDGGQCFFFDGTYQDFLDRIGWAEEAGNKKKAEKNAASKETKPKTKEDNRARAEAIQAKNRSLKPLTEKVKKLEDQIARSESREGAIESELIEASTARDATKIAELGQEMEALRKELDQLYAEWETAQTELARI